MSILLLQFFLRELQVYTSITVVPELYSGQQQDFAGDNKRLDMHISYIIKVVNLILVNLNSMFEILPSVSVLTEIVWSTIFIAHKK